MLERTAVNGKLPTRMRFHVRPWVLLPLPSLLTGCPQLSRDDFVKAHATDEASGGAQNNSAITSQGISLTSAGEALHAASTGTDAGSTDGLGGSENSGTGGAATEDTGTNHGGSESSPSVGGNSGMTSGGIEIGGCTDKRTLTQPLLTDFEAYDGMTPALEYRFSFSASGVVWGELLDHGDASGNYALSFVSGAVGSEYAVSAENPRASNWGGGVSLRIHCVDASAFRGVEFMMRGTTPAARAVVTLLIDDSQSFVHQVDIGRTWQRETIAFSAFEPGNDTPSAAETNGDGITGIVWSSELEYTEVTPGVWEPEPGSFEIQIDDVAFFE